MRKKMVAGNWKMNKTVADAVELAAGVAGQVQAGTGVDVVICPPFTALKPVADVLAGSAVALGAQNMHWAEQGAYTGEIAPAMLREVGCAYVILGHSERRALFGATNETVNRKAKAAFGAGLTPIVCVGETLEQREAGRTEAVVRDHVVNSLAELGAQLANVIIAYEPVWAIGTGKTATPEQAQDVHAFVRGLVAGMADEKTAAAVRILYGGSVKPDNAKDLFSRPDIDGGLIGGASLKADSFVAIVNAAR
ncbi:MAG: triose-phosphate isomerase [Kiritimatiellae bacterium]|nr:triose-phosphate isomerase [Kiritimatiellia bacterium]